MKLGVHLVNFSLPGGPETIGPTLAATGRAAEEAGLDNLSFMDHYLQLEFLAGAEDPMLEGYTALGFLAAHTSSVELQLLMTGVTYRHPGLLAKIVVDARRALRRPGRARHRRGLVRARAPRPRRTVPAARRAVRAARGDPADRAPDVDVDDGPFDGTHYRLAETINSPAAAADAAPADHGRRRR